jgi:hypothetical protein
MKLDWQENSKIKFKVHLSLFSTSPLNNVHKILHMYKYADF